MLPFFTLQVFTTCSPVLFLFFFSLDSFFHPSNIFITSSLFIEPLSSNLSLSPMAFMVCTPSSHTYTLLPNLYYTPAPCYSLIKKKKGKKSAINNTEMTLIVCRGNVRNVHGIWKSQISMNPAVAHTRMHV